MKTRLPDQLIVVVLAACGFLIQSLAWPLSAGRDFESYILYYLEMGQTNPLYPLLMVFRTPIVPIFHGSVLQYGGANLDELIMGILFCISILLIYKIGLRWNRRIAWGSALALILYPSYGLMYHQVSSEGLFAFGLILWLNYIFNSVESPNNLKFVVHGIFVFILILIRPVAQVFLAFAVFPLTFYKLSPWKKFRFSLAFLFSSVFLILTYSAYNFIRYNDFTVSRSSGAHIPLYRLFVADYEFLPLDANNGPRSTKLIDAIESDLLKKEPYLSYGIDLETFVASGNSRMWGDLVSLSDRIWGWNSDYKYLRLAAIETIQANPINYIFRVIRSFIGAFWKTVIWNSPQRISIDEKDEIEFDTNGLPAPTEGQLIPISNTWWLASSPDQHYQVDWQHYYATGEIQLVGPVWQDHFLTLEGEKEQLVSKLPPRNGLRYVSDALNWISQFFPRILLFVLVGIAGLFYDPRKDITLWFMVGLSFLYLVISYSGVYTITEFRVPFDPLYILGGVIGGTSIYIRFIEARR